MVHKTTRVIDIACTGYQIPPQTLLSVLLLREIGNIPFEKMKMVELHYYPGTQRMVHNYAGNRHRIHQNQLPPETLLSALLLREIGNIAFETMKMVELHYYTMNGS